MALNRNFFVPTFTLTWAGQEVGTLRGITPDDIARIMSENAADVESLLESFERDKILGNVDVSKDEQLQQALADNTQRMFAKVLSLVPQLVAKVIACAMEAPDDAEFIRTKFNAALQMEAIAQIAKLTFVDQNGFKAFMGNVLGLVGNAGVGKASQPRSLAQSEASTSDTAG